MCTRVVAFASRAMLALSLVILPAGAQSPRSGDARTARTPSSLVRDMLDAHNAVRAQMKVPPLQWSEQLAGHARQWAGNLLARRQFFHQPNSAYGENLFQITGASAAPIEVVRDWASESRNYDYRSNTCRGVCGHYTQIVWRDSKRLGCAVARGGGREVWVCNYDPPGNWVGERPY
jgi:uncharacterized protein YkwD